MRLVFLLCIAASIVHAHPKPNTPAVAWLMDEPVSLWDLGILRVEQHLQHTFVSSVKTKVRYTHNDKLVILAVDYGEVKKDPEGHCRNLVGLIKDELFVSSVTGEPAGLSKVSRLSYFFTHVGDHSPDWPPGTTEELDAITVIRVSIPQIIRCEAPLMGKDISCEPHK